MIWIERVKNAHLSVTSAVSHHSRMQSDRYFVWAEEDAPALSAEGKHAVSRVRGTTDFFTKTEYDPWKKKFEQALGRWGISWELISIQYEEDTGFFHYEYSWEMPDGEDDF